MIMSPTEESTHWQEACLAINWR